MSKHLTDPRVVIDSYVIEPSGYDTFVNSDRDMWCMTVVNGHAYGWSIRRGRYGNSEMAMNRKGEWIYETRGSGHNKARRWSLDEALSIALHYVDTQKINGCTAFEASEFVANRP